jgi:tellurite resistance protein
MKNIFKSLFALVVIATTFSTQAQPIRKTQVEQHERIVQGEKSGQLTPQEARRLKAEQRRIQAERRVAKADGKITPRERKIIRHDQRKASRDIYVEKHDVEHK